MPRKGYVGLDPILFKFTPQGLPPRLARYAALNHNNTPQAKKMMTNWKQYQAIHRDYVSLANLVDGETYAVCAKLAEIHSISRTSVYYALKRIAEQLHREHPEFES